MPVEHMVWIKFKPGVGPERIEHHLAGLRSLASSVKVVRSLRIGPNFTDRSNGFTHGLIVTVNCRGCLQEYLDHPEHLRVALPLRQDAEILAMDIDT